MCAIRHGTFTFQVEYSDTPPCRALSATAQCFLCPPNAKTYGRCRKHCNTLTLLIELQCWCSSYRPSRSRRLQNKMPFSWSTRGFSLTSERSNAINCGCSVRMCGCLTMFKVYPPPLSVYIFSYNIKIQMTKHLQ